MTPSRRLIVSLALTVVLAACSKGGGGGAPLTGEMSLGDAKAKVKVIEYASTTCHFCADFNNKVFPAFKKKYIDTGKVHYTLREILTPPDDVAAAGFLTARCAGKDKVFSVIDAIYKQQAQIVAPGASPRDTLLPIAQEAGLSEDQFKACLVDEKEIQALNTRVETYTRDAAITGTPTFVVNGKKMDGQPTLERLDAAIAEAGG
jgi:protein-disulfide isomerase